MEDVAAYFKTFYHNFLGGAEELSPSVSIVGL
jgi:hypothetical protein